jgi:hypothetical protein
MRIIELVYLFAEKVELVFVRNVKSPNGMIGAASKNHMRRGYGSHAPLTPTLL